VERLAPASSQEAQIAAERGAPLDSTARETAVVIVVDDPALGVDYGDLYPELATIGIPPHVTLLYPFVRPDELDRALPLLAATLARHERFAFSLTEVRTFPRTVWIAPDPAAPFAAVTAAIHAAFPDHPPYGGEFAEVIHHVTLVDGIDDDELPSTLALARSRVEPLLPIHVVAAEAVVLAEQEDGRWIVSATLQLGHAARSGDAA